jgi:hypothetical protein
VGIGRECHSHGGKSKQAFSCGCTVYKTREKKNCQAAAGLDWTGLDCMDMPRRFTEIVCDNIDRISIAGMQQDQQVHLAAMLYRPGGI